VLLNGRTTDVRPEDTIPLPPNEAKACFTGRVRHQARKYIGLISIAPRARHFITSKM